MTDAIKSFKDMLSHVVDAIHHVVQVEVTIIDRNYVRLAATGHYANLIGSCISSHSAFAKAMQNKSSYFIDKPGQDVICAECGNVGSCVETAEVCCPILLENEAVGAIGLIAFDHFQREQLIIRKKELMPFLESMANLIGAKMLEMRQAEELALLTDAVDDPLIIIDEKGQIQRFNAAAKQVFCEAKMPEKCLIENGTSIENIFVEGVAKRIHDGQKRFTVRTKHKQLSYDLVAKGFDEDKRYILTLKPIKSVIGDANRFLEGTATTKFSDILGENERLLDVKHFAERAAKSKSAVLILGESGTGKELFARAVHEASDRKKQVFLAVNCAAIPETLIESELFGYEEGAFSGGAKGGRIGRFEQANHGTLFLDEIGDMPLHLQAKLLRVLQEGTIQKLGSSREIPVDVRIITATHRHLDEMVDEGSFRRDLFYRINVIPIEIPALRERASDIPLLVEAFIEKSCFRLGKMHKKMAKETLEQLCSYPWYGNVRELENAIEYMVNMSGDEILYTEHLPPKIRNYFGIEKGAQMLGENDRTRLDAQTGERGERVDCPMIREWAIEQLAHLLKQNGKSAQGIKKTCEALGISRATYYRKVKQMESQNEIFSK